MRSVANEPMISTAWLSERLSIETEPQGEREPEKHAESSPTDSVDRVAARLRSQVVQAAQNGFDAELDVRGVLCDAKLHCDQ